MFYLFLVQFIIIDALALTALIAFWPRKDVVNAHKTQKATAPIREQKIVYLTDEHDKELIRKDD